MRKYLAVFLGMYLLFAGALPARAQGTARLNLYALQTASFPVVSAGLDVFDSYGNIVTGLGPDAVTLLEDNQPRSLNTFDEVQTGVEFALAIDPGPLFAYRDANGISRYEKIVQILTDWASNHPDTLGDDLSLVPTYGTLSTHLSTTAAFSDLLAAYRPDLPTISPSLNTLARALDTVSEQAPRVGMKRSVLFVTSPTSVDDIPTLQNLTERAIGQDVRVNVWIVTSADFFSASGATALKDLAMKTRGQYFLFSGEEPLPGLDAYLAPLRSTYRLSYQSGLVASGRHTLTAQVSLNDETLTSTALTFELNILPPNPVLVNPPDQIVRSAPDKRTTATTAFLPMQQPIDILVEFPDGRKRPLVLTALFVDNQKVAENTAEPFNHFTWDLSGYAASGEHSLSVEVVDSLGLTKLSLGVPVTVTVVRPQFGLLPFLSRNSIWVTLGAILFAGAVLGVILAGGRIRRRSRAPTRGAPLDPLIQPVEAEPGRHKLRLSLKRPAKPSAAYLERLKDDGQPVTAPPIPVSVPEMTFGSDPLQAARILDDPSVSPLHARLQEKNGEYFLSDEKSVAGTWVNSELLTAPRRLQHGDVLHIGRLSYRFMLRKPPERPAPRITPTRI